RERVRREWVSREARRVLARRERFLITENKLGIVQAASGVDASNVDGGEIALLPSDPDASALALRNGLRERLGVEVAVVITDTIAASLCPSRHARPIVSVITTATMGRAWRLGQTDAAIGSSGVSVLHDYAGA